MPGGKQGGTRPAEGRGGLWIMLLTAALLLAAIALLGLGLPRLLERPSSCEELRPGEDRRLVIYSSLPQVVSDLLVGEFEQRAGLWVQVETGETAELLDRLAEEGADTPCDLFLGGGMEQVDARSELFAAYESPLAAALPADRLGESGIWTPLSPRPMVIIYNPKLVRTDPPSRWEDLLDRDWRGRIAFPSPAETGLGYTALTTLLQALPADEAETLDRLAANLAGRQLDAWEAVIGQVADGDACLGVTALDDALRGVDEGYDLAIVCPREGTSALCDGMAVTRYARHRTNAQAFIDFALGADAQGQLSAACRRPELEDPLEGLALLDYDRARACGRREELLAAWAERVKEAAP